jgi:hypothetical protein
VIMCINKAPSARLHGKKSSGKTSNGIAVNVAGQ